LFKGGKPITLYIVGKIINLSVISYNKYNIKMKECKMSININVKLKEYIKCI